MEDSNIVYKYYQWLWETYLDDGKHHYYSRLLEKLFEREYYWALGYDQNREDDGLELRWLFESSHEFVDDEGKEFEKWDGETPCSVLEMLCALSKRVEDYITCPVRGEPDYSRWFWTMLENCGLLTFNDDDWDEEKVDQIISFVLDRKYSKDGVGGFWPLKNPRKDQRKVDLWYQANYYIGERNQLC